MNLSSVLSLAITAVSTFLIHTVTCCGADLSAATADAGPDSQPVILGHGIGRFVPGEMLAEDKFDNLDNWVVQIQERSGAKPAKVEARNQTLDCYLPGRGCTIWFKRKLPSRVAITYEVVCPTPPKPIKGLQPRDINNFWMASDPSDSEQGLFDPTRYTGAFSSYAKMHAYYASTGGGGGSNVNQTTRMRRYPREVDGAPSNHIAMNDKDGKAGFLIIPDKVMKVQLVAFDDLIQYIVDDKLIYQLQRDDRTTVETRNRDGKTESTPTTYDQEQYPVYDEGFFGFRMVGTHHVYSNFRVFALEPDAEQNARPTRRVSSLDALREAIAESHQHIVLEPGNYRVDDRHGFRFSGSHNDVDLQGVHLEVPLRAASGRTLFRLTGDHITIRGGTVEDTYPDGSTEVTDFGRYNRRHRFGGMNEMSISGDDNRIIGMKMTVRGSYPYGYGNMYGIGAGSVLSLRKHCGIQISGDRALIDSCDIKMEAFGHALYVQGGDRTTVRNTRIEGTLRPSNDCYKETHESDLARRFNYQLQWPDLVRGLPIPRDHMINCTEDGIRAYKGAGNMIVEDCVVQSVRGGIKLYMAKRAHVSRCQVLDCVVQGYSLPGGGVIENSSGNAAYGPLLYIHSDRHSNQNIDLHVLPAPHSLGDHPLAALKGRGHNITFRSSIQNRQEEADERGGQGSTETQRPIIVGYPMRFDFLCIDYPNVPKGHESHFQRHSPDTYEARNITLVNETAHPVVLGALSESNSVTSVGPVRDLGIRNSIVTENDASETARE